MRARTLQNWGRVGADAVKHLTKRTVIILVAVTGLGLCLTYFFAATFIRWAIVGFTILDIAIWLYLAAAQYINLVRYGRRKTLGEILAENDSVRIVRLLRYHLGWSPSKIAAELNRREVFNSGLPWQKEDICRIIKGMAIF